MTKDKTVHMRVYAAPVSCAMEIDYEQLIAASSDLRDMDVRTMYDEDF